MPTTANIDMPYPDESSDASLNVHIAALAGAVDSRIGPYVVDTGWVNVSLFSAFVGGSPRVRRIGKQVFFQGSTVSGSFPVGSVNIGVIPAGFRPSSTTRFAAYLTGGQVGIIGVLGNGDIQVHNQSGATRTSLQFSVNWLID